MPEDVFLREYSLSGPVRLGPADLTLLGPLTDRIGCEPTTGSGIFRLRSNSWVGVLELDRVRVRVLPKVDDLDNVLMMFASVAGLAEHTPRLSTYGRHDLVEGIAELVLRTIDQATRRGLIHGYRSREERLPLIRGRILISELASRPWEQWPIPCRYDDFTADVSENRVLRAAVTTIRRWVTTPEVRRLAAELEGRFEEVQDSTVPMLEADLIRASPLNEHYQPALALARMVLEGAGIAHAEGDVAATSFLVDMNKLYERWIGAELTVRLWPQLQVCEQDGVLLSRRPRLPMRPDLLFRSAGKPVLVGDVKYKLTGTGLARIDDYYQLLAYTTALRMTRGILVYCQADEKPDRVVPVEGGGQRLSCHPLSLGGSQRDIVASLDRLADAVRLLAAQEQHELA